MTTSVAHSSPHVWLPLPVAAWQDTYQTLHLWTQIIGKIRLALAPKLNHWWHSTLYVTPRGLTTSTMPAGTRTFQITFDFLQHQLLIETSDGITKTIALAPRSVADFYQAVMSTLKEIGIEVQIWTMPQEIADPIPFEQDKQHAAYDPEFAQRFWQILLQADRLLTVFRARYAGKCSPVHFFWGSFDLAVTRFSGRRAPEHPGGVPGMADWVTREAYSHDVSSCGFWFGGGAIEALFYAYAYPAPDGFKEYPIQPPAAFYSAEMQEFVLPYEAVRRADNPDVRVLEFLQSTYEAAATLGHWDGAALATSQSLEAKVTLSCGLPLWNKGSNVNRSHLTAWVLMGSLLSALCTQPIAAQVIPDNTLPVGERSQVSGNPTVQIDGGARRGGNLFHSFSQFSVPTGGSAYFNNAADVQNIFSRVTGGSVSNIDGLIRANGTANLFLLNPNGILFGPNASLNIGGSFVATTANAIGFPNGEVFSSDATQPLPSQLLTVNPNAFFFNQPTPQPIVNQSRFDERVFNPSSFSGTGLHVLSGQNLLLVGGTIQFDSGEPFIPTSLPGRPLLGFGKQNVQPDGGWLISPGSYVELGAVGGVGTVGLSTASSDWQLTIPNAVPRTDVSFRNGSGIDIRGASGSIRVLAQTIDISKSELLVGIPRDSGLSNTQTGDLELNTTGSVALSMSILDSTLSGQGNTGSINLIAGDQIFLDRAGIYSTVRPTGDGNAGNINIATKSLSLTRSSVESYTDGRGSAGKVNINARDTVSFNDFSNIYDTVRGGIGNAGDINITTGSLSLTNGGLTSFQSGSGNAGSININARDTVSLTQNSGLTSYASTSGNAGGINVNAYNTVSLDNSSIFNLVILGTGNVGGINITTGSLSLTNGAQLLSTTLGQGNGGSVNINARDRVSVDGAFLPEDAYSYYRTSRIRTRTVAGAEGQGGAVTISTGSLFLTNGGGVETSTLGRGNAGRVLINARDVQIRGTSPPIPTGLLKLAPLTDYRSGVYTSATSGSVGDAGNVSINTRTLSVADQGRINTNAQGQGRAGSIQIQASDTVSFSQGDAISTLELGAVGNGGNIDITARSLSVLNNAQLSASTSGDGNAGNITARADTVNVNSGGRLLTTTSSNGRAGDITVKTPDLQLTGATSGLFTGTNSAGDAGNLTIQPRGNGQSVRVNLQDGAQISASTSSSGRGGDLTIAAPESITLTGDGSIIAAGTGGSGAGGNLNLTTGTLNIENRAEVTVSSSGTGSAGNLFVDADRIFLNNQGSIRADTTGGGGNINLRSPFILLRNGSNITTNATGSNIPGGNIAIDTRFLIAVPNEDSNISANSEDFRGGNVRINAFSIYGIQSRPIATPLSDITATGATSALNGTIDVITAGLDPTSGLVALPTDLVDSSGLIAQGCPANRGNSFVITGRGGLPPTPEQQLDDDAEWSDRRRLVVAQKMDQGSGGRGDADFGVSFDVSAQPNSAQSNETRRRRDVSDSKISDTPIIEATGVQVTSTGEIFLVATTPDPTIQNRLNQAVACQGR